MSEEYKPLPTVLEALADLRSQVENCDGTAQIDTDAADAVLAAFQASKPLPERVTLATVGESFYHSNAIAHAAVCAGITKDELILLLLENEQRLRDVASSALMKTPPIHLRVGIQSPIRLSERKPGPDDCLEIKTTEHAMHFCWLCYPVMHYGDERLIWDWKMIPMANERGWERWTYWLPASTKYLPVRVEG